MSRKERLDYTWHDMKRNYMCYLMLLPFMLLFLVFTVIPVIMSLPMGFTDFDMASAPKFVGLQNFYTLFLGTMFSFSPSEQPSFSPSSQDLSAMR